MRRRSEWKLALDWLVSWNQWRIYWLKSNNCWFSLSSVIVHEVHLWVHVSCLDCVGYRLVNWNIADHCASLHRRNHCCIYGWLNYDVWVQYCACLLTKSCNVYAVWSQNIIWNSTVCSDKAQSIFKSSATSQSVPEIWSEVKLGAHGVHKTVQEVSLIKSGFKWLVGWVIHTEIFIDPNFGISISVETDHALSNSTWHNKSAQIWIPSQGVEQDDSWLLSVESGYRAEEDRNCLSEYVGILLWSTETKPWTGEVCSEDLNPVASWSSLGINFNFIIDLSVWLDIEMVEIGFLALAVSHDFVKHWSVGFVPVLRFKVKTVSFWIMAAHSLLDYFKKIRFYSFYLKIYSFIYSKFPLNFQPTFKILTS